MKYNSMGTINRYENLKASYYVRCIGIEIPEIFQNASKTNERIKMTKGFEKGTLLVNKNQELFASLDNNNSGESSETVNVIDVEGTVRKYMSDSLKPVPANVVKYFCDRSFEKQIRGTYLSRGKNYFASGRVKSVSYDLNGTKITGIVSGSENYTAVIEIKKNIMINICSCPVGGSCKHVAALAYQINYSFLDLSRKITYIQQDDALVKSSKEIHQLAGIREAVLFLINQPANTERIMYVTRDLISAANDCPDEYAKLLEYYAMRKRKFDEKKALIDAAGKLPGGKYFVSLLKDLMGYDSYGKYCHLDLNEMNGNPADLSVCEDLFRYYKPGYILKRDHDKIFPLFTLKSPLDNNLIEFGVRFGDYIVVQATGIGDLSITEAIRCIHWYVKNTFGSEYAQRLDELKKEIEEEKRAMLIEDLSRRIDTFASNMNSGQQILLSKEKACLSFEFNLNRTEAMLSLKIGLKRKYVVKNISDFASKFERKRTFKYGKEFTFTHNIENIVPEQRDALKIILIAASGYESGYSYRDARYLSLPGNLTDELFHALKGQTVLINGKEMYLSLEKIPSRVTMSKSCVLNIQTDVKDFATLMTVDKIYLLDNEQNEVRLLSSDYNEAMLYNFVINNRNLSMEPVMDKFRDEIYARFYTKIDIADSLKERLKLSQLDIKAYFDYVKSAITVDYNFFKEDAKITASALSSTTDKRKAEDFLNYLGRIGFEDGKITDEGLILNFFSMDMTELKKIAEVYLSESIQNKSLHNFRTQNIKIQYANNIMEAFLDDSDYSDKELKDILKAIRHKKKFVLLSGDRIINLDNEDAAEFESTVYDLKLDENALSKHAQIPVPKALRALAHEKGCKVDDYLYNMIDDIRRFKTGSEPVPNVNAVLRPYQKEGFQWLKVLSNYHVGGILADDMGLGKTLEVITLLKSDEAKMPSLVVCPKSVVFNWVNEFERFDPEANVIGIYGNADDRHAMLNSLKKDEKICIVTSYDSLRLDEEYYNFPLKYMVLDEAQYIKNVNAQKSKAAKSLKADIRLALTGTPIENNVLDLWSIFDFIMPGYLDELADFKHNYSGSEKYTQVIAKKIAPFVLRRTKREVLKDLPEKYERIISAEMVPEQRKVYDAYRLEAREALESGSSAFEVLPYLMRLRQICDDPSMFAANYNGGSGKINALKEIICDYLENNHRILVFSQFVRAIEQIEGLLKSKNISYNIITGKTSSEDRIRIMNDFNAGAGGDVLLISLKAGGTGLNLTGADTVIHFDPWWNTAAEDQASDRAHRIGQTRNVEVIKLICENSVEQKVIELQNTKKDIIDKLISNTDKSVTGISIDDVKFILRDF